MSKLYAPNIVNGATGNIFFVPASASIADYVASADDNDTLVLSAATYTLTSPVHISRPLTIVGQGDTTYIYSASTRCFLITSSNVRLSNMKAYGYVSTWGQGAIHFFTTSATPLSGCALDSMNVTSYVSFTAGFSASGSVKVHNTNCDIYRCKFYCEGSSGFDRYSNSLSCSVSSASSACVVNIYDTEVGFTGTNRWSNGIEADNNPAGSSYSLTVNIYNPYVYCSGASDMNRGIAVEGLYVSANVYGGYVYGSTYDIAGFSAAYVNTYGTTLGNNNSSGYITNNGVLPSKNFITGGYRYKSVGDSLTASAVQSQGQGALTKDINRITTCAVANDVVTLPSAVAGMSILVINSGAQTLQIFPASGDFIDAQLVNTSTTLAAGKAKRFMAWSASNWVMKAVN